MISSYLTDKLLDHVFGKTTYTAPATLYLGMFTTMPAADGSGGVEVSGGSYARVAITNDTTSFPAAVAKSKSNGTTLTFVQASADWGDVLGAGIFDALSGGNLLVFGTLAADINVHLNGIVAFNIGQAVISTS